MRKEAEQMSRSENLPDWIVAELATSFAELPDGTPVYWVPTAEEASWDEAIREQTINFMLSFKDEDEYRAYERAMIEMQAESEAEERAGGRAICPNCGERKFKSHEAVTLGYAGHPGAEISVYRRCENCNHTEM